MDNIIIIYIYLIFGPIVWVVVRFKPPRLHVLQRWRFVLKLKREEGILVISKLSTRICCMPRTKTHPLIGFTLHHARSMYRFALAAVGLSRVGVPANGQITERRGNNLNSRRRHGVIIIWERRKAEEKVKDSYRAPLQKVIVSWGPLKGACLLKFSHITTDIYIYKYNIYISVCMKTRGGCEVVVVGTRKLR